MGAPLLLLGLFDTSIMTARCFNKEGIQVYGMDYEKKHLGFYSKDIIAIEVPDPNIDEKEWFHFVLGWLKKQANNSKFIVIPTSDLFVQLYVKYEVLLSDYCSALMPNQFSVETIIRRDQQFLAASECGIYVPPYVVGNGKLNIVSHHHLNYPLAIKPLDSPQWKRYFNNKGFVVYNTQELNDIMTQLRGKDIDYIIQTIIEGDNRNNYEVNSLYLPDNNIIQHSIRKIRQYPDRFGTATCIEVCKMPEIEQLATQLISKLNLVGFSNIEFKYNKIDGKFYYIETNPRVWLQVNFSKNIGINFPKLYYNFLANKQLIPKDLVIKNGKWVDFLPDLLYWLKYKKKYSITLLHFIRSWMPIRSTSLFSIRDPKPFLKDLRLIDRILHKRTN